MLYGYGVLNNHVPTLRATVMGSSIILDTDALAFISAASITDATQKNAVNTLVTNLKGYGIWNKMKAIYPFVGGTAAQHRFNLKDPRAVNAAFYLDFIGGGTHSSTGYLPNGTTAYADTKLIPSSILSLNSMHISVYIRQNISEGNYDIGTCTNGVNDYSVIATRTPANNFRVLINEGTINEYINNDSKGHYIGNRTSSNVVNGFKNASKLINSTNSSVNLSTHSIYLGALNNAGTAVFLSSKEQAFVSIGYGLTDTEAANLYTAVQTFETTLGRQV